MRFKQQLHGFVCSFVLIAYFERSNFFNLLSSFPVMECDPIAETQANILDLKIILMVDVPSEDG